MRVEVLRPNKSETRYEFACIVTPSLRSSRALLDWAKQCYAARTLHPQSLRFGFHALNYEIAHHEVWDAIYPLMYLTRRCGPFFFGGHDRTALRFRYPIPTKVAEFFIARARSFGIDLVLQADTNEARFDCETGGHVLALGGGKDSRLALGVLRELGTPPVPVTTGARYAEDLPEARLNHGLSPWLTDRIMPAFMLRGGDYYFGGCLGEVLRRRPWQQHYDTSAAVPLDELSHLFSSLGLATTAHSPTSILPSNLTQKILSYRYAGLSAHQRSTEPHDRSEKNLHVSLCKLHHAIDFSAHCSEALFVELAEAFVQKSLTSPDDHGFRDHREAFDLEIRALLYRHRDHPLLSSLRDRLPDRWQATWLDYVYPAVAPTTPAGFTEICTRYAPVVDQAPLGERRPPFRI